MDKIEETYLDIISESYHHKPFMGWTHEKFLQIIKGEVLKTTKKYALAALDNQIVKKGIYSFKKVFKEDPIIQATGSGKNTKIQIIFEKEFNEKDVALFAGVNKNKDKIDELYKQLGDKNKNTGDAGNDSDDGDFSEEVINNYTSYIISEGLFSKKEKSIERKIEELENSASEDLGIIFNPAFYKTFLISKVPELKEALENKNEDEHIGESIDDRVIDVLKGKTFGIVFEFSNPEYVQLKKKDFLNPNYVKSMNAKVKFFINEVGSDIEIGTATWEQKRTANMDPPKPLSQEVKERWNNPANTYGVAGLLMKKALGGALHMFNIGTGGTIQEENFTIDISSQFTYGENQYNLGADTKEEREESKKNEAAMAKGNQKFEKIIGMIQEKINLSDGYVLEKSDISSTSLEYDVKKGNIVLYTISFSLKGNTTNG